MLRHINYQDNSFNLYLVYSKPIEKPNTINSF